MPFSDLNPASQQFLQKYFKSGNLFRKGTSQEQKDELADDLIRWQAARKDIILMLQNVPAEMDNGSLTANLAKITELVEGANDKPDFGKGLQALGVLKAQIETTGDAYFRRLKKEATDAVVEMRGYLGNARELPRFEDRLTGMDRDIARTPPNYNAVKAAHLFISQSKADQKRRSDEYAARYQGVREYIKTRCEDLLPRISDDIVSTERTRIKGRIALALTKLAEHADRVAEGIARSTNLEIHEAIKIVGKKADYATVKAEGIAAFQKLTAALNAGGEAEYPLIKADKEQADQFEADRDFYNATLIMKPLPDRVKPLLERCAAHTRYETALKGANDAVDQLKAHHLAHYVAADILSTEALIAACAKLANNGAYGDAITRLNTVERTCKDLETEAEDAAPFAQLLQDAATGSLPELLAQAKDRLAALEKHARVGQVSEAMGDLSGIISNAEGAINDAQEAQARALLTSAAELASLTLQLAEAIDRIYTRGDSLAAGVSRVASSHAQAEYIAVKLAEVSELVEAGRAMALNADDGALQKLTDGEDLLEQAVRLADAEAAFRAELAKLRTEANELAKGDYPQKDTIAPQIPANLTKAEEHSGNFDHIKASQSLTAAKSLLVTARIARASRSSEGPGADDLKTLMALPGGQKMLDDMVTNLPPDTSQAVFINVLAVRFEMNAYVFENKTRRANGQRFNDNYLVQFPAPILRQYYQMLASVPDTHTRLNPSLARFDQVEDVSGSYYNSLSGSIVMGCKSVFNVQMNPLAEPTQLDGIEAGCEPVPHSEDAPDPSYGKWTTMHEIGHAVDDRKRFMSSREGNSDFGGWINHSRDTSQIAPEVAENFNFDPYYVERRMAGGTPDMPDPPEGVDARQWEKRKDAFEEWLEAVSVGKALWKNASESSARRIRKSNRVIHEAYEGRWVSYDYAARARGVSGYQFRAPGEWFSELYAAYHTKKLNPSHPAATWLSQL